MKRLTPIAKRRMRHAARKAARRHQKQVRRKGRSNRRSNSPSRQQKPIWIRAPEVFSLVDQTARRQVMEFLDNLRGATGHRRIGIDFSKTTKLSPCGMLIFMSKIEALLNAFPGKFHCSYPSDGVVEQLFQHIGLLRKFGLTPRTRITSDMVKHWFYLQGTCTDTSGLGALLEGYEQSLSEAVRSKLYASLTEAITNVINHAYPNRDGGAGDRKWWMFAQRKDGRLFIAVLDEGIGIPVSLKRKKVLSDYVRQITSTSRKSLDERLIGVAVGTLRTSTQLPFRGKGLPEMLEFIEELADGSLLIMSGRGCFSCSGKDHSRNGTTYPIPLPGTMVFWEIPLEGNQRGNDDLDS